MVLYVALQRQPVFQVYSESDEDTSNHCSSSSATLQYSVNTNCCSHTIIVIIMQKAQDKEYT